MLFRRSRYCSAHRTGTSLKTRFLFFQALIILFFVGPNSLNAQTVYRDDLPFFAPADSTSRMAMVVDFNRFEDGKFGWSVNRLLVSVVLPAGDKGVYYIRMPFASFDTGDVPLFSRWPWVRNPEGEIGWPNGRLITSFGQPEIGSTGLAPMPVLDRLYYSVGLGLPTGAERLYPFSSTGMPLRLELRKVFELDPLRELGVTLGYLATLASSSDQLNEDEAYPSGFHVGSVLNWYRGRNSRLALAYDFHNFSSRISQTLGIQAWMPWTDDASLGLKVSRELQGSLDRPAAWYFTISFRLDNDDYRPGRETTGRDLPQ